MEKSRTSGTNNIAITGSVAQKNDGLHIAGRQDLFFTSDRQRKRSPSRHNKHRSLSVVSGHLSHLSAQEAAPRLHDEDLFPEVEQPLLHGVHEEAVAALHLSYVCGHAAVWEVSAVWGRADHDVAARGDAWVAVLQDGEALPHKKWPIHSTILCRDIQAVVKFSWHTKITYLTKTLEIR